MIIKYICSDMKQISIIGLSRAGKTCYTFAMAKTMKRGINGITIFAPDSEQRDKLELGWRGIRKDHTWPPTSDTDVPYDFQCMLNLRPVMDFCWKDFKGGILSSFDEINTKYRVEFSQYLHNSAGMIFFIAADMMNRILMDTLEAEDNLYDLELLNNIILENSNIMNRIPITIAITKSDLLDNNAKSAVLEMVKEIFPSFFTVGNNVKVLTVPVSLGQQLGNCEQGQQVAGEIYSDPKAGNIHLPIMFNLYHYLKEYIAEIRQEIDSMENDLRNHGKVINTASEHSAFGRWWRGEDLDELRNERQRMLNKINETKNELDQQEMNLELVRREFTKDCQYYVNGKLQTL